MRERTERRIGLSGGAAYAVFLDGAGGTACCETACLECGSYHVCAYCCRLSSRTVFQDDETALIMRPAKQLDLKGVQRAHEGRMKAAEKAARDESSEINDLV